MQNQAIYLMGPTAVGKTALAIQLAQILPVDLISVDSAMVYRGLDIGSGKPTTEELAIAPHQLINICDPSEPYSVAKFCVDARAAMQKSWDNKRIPLLVGGTMLYFKALQFGLADLPSANPEVRLQLASQAEEIGWPEMHAKLAAIDPTAAQRIKPNDTQRIQRALEINITTGHTLTKSFEQQTRSELDHKLHSFALMPEARDVLHAKIAQRFLQMLENGFVAEVECLLQRGDLNSELPAIRAVGYRQVWDLLLGNIDYSTMVAQATAATRQLAKRQITWIRGWPGEIQIYNNDSLLLDTIVSAVLHSANN